MRSYILRTGLGSMAIRDIESALLDWSAFGDNERAKVRALKPGESVRLGRFTMLRVE